MKKQISLLAILLLCLATTAWAASSIVSVSVGSAGASPSLIFGEEAEAKKVAYPPFSGMFDVKDLYLVNPSNFSTLEVKGDMERLGTDIRASVADGDYWLLVSNSDATLYFAVEGDVNYKAVYFTELSNETRAEEGTETKDIRDGGSLSVKAGIVYKFYQAGGSVVQEPVTRAVIPSTQYDVCLIKNSETGRYEGSSTEIAGKDSRTFYIDVVTTDGPVYMAAQRGDIPMQYYKSGETQAEEIEEADTEDGWVLCCVYPKSTNLVVNYVDRRITITVPEEDDDQEWVMLDAWAKKSSLKPITTYLSIDDEAKFGSINWTIKKAGTIDYDGDGDVDGNDAMYLYNYVNAGRGEKTTTRNLNKFLYDAKEAEIQTALDTMLGNMDALDLDGDGDVDGNDAMYLYNYVNAGRGDKTTTRNLNKFLYEATEAEIQTALENILNYAP